MNQSDACGSRYRRAVTLIELLIVMGILVLLASISLGALRGLLRGQKVPQAAITVRQYLQNAQVRAQASGRPVAVFFDRISMLGQGGNPSQQFFSANRIQFGEVFEAYSGDTSDAVGTLESLDFAAMSPPPLLPKARLVPTTYTDDANADMIVLPLASVAAGFGLGTPGSGGFIQPHDSIEFVGYPGKYIIETYRIDPGNSSQVEVHFFNPPNTFAEEIRKKLDASEPLNVDYEQKALNYPSTPCQVLPVGTADVKFRIYRQPTRSLVGAVALPRGTCVDLSVSGVGVTDNTVDGNRAFGLQVSNGVFPASLNPGEFSRIGLVFGSDGRLSYIIDENTRRVPTLRRILLDANSMVYLMVGRSDQVLPGYSGSGLTLTPMDTLTPALKVAALQHPDPAVNATGNAALPVANLLDPENVWVTCNPLTGEVRSAPMAAIAINASASLSAHVRDARALAAAGLSN